MCICCGYVLVFSYSIVILWIKGDVVIAWVKVYRVRFVYYK